MGSVFSNHFDAIRVRLAAEGKIASTFYNNTNKGNIREVFAKELLENGTPKQCSIGSGEIIHREMRRGEKRNQIDLVLYNSRFPKLVGAGGVDLFFIETVSSIVEVKSVLTKADVRQAAQAAKVIKSYPNPSFKARGANRQVVYPRPYAFLFAYDAEVKDIKNVETWMKEVSREEDYQLQAISEIKPEERAFAPHLFIDGVFVLNKGFVFIDAMPFSNAGITSSVIPSDHFWVRGEKDELEIMWAATNLVGEAMELKPVNLVDYISEKQMIVSSWDD